MTKAHILELTPKWQNKKEDNTFCINAKQVFTGHCFGTFPLNTECHTLAEVEAVVASIRADLDAIEAEAKQIFSA
ncbi:MAG: hypothetical protein WCD42_13950 [Rhizomicrobium sp.]